MYSDPGLTDLGSQQCPHPSKTWGPPVLPLPIPVVGTVSLRMVKGKVATGEPGELPSPENSKNTFPYTPQVPQIG